VLDEFYAVVDENLSSEFGVIKEDMKFTRFTRRGIENVKMEFLLVCIGYNLKKYHKYRLKKEKKQPVN
ncbi:transposase, partial [Thomasclavelia cocleata]